MKKVLVTGGAGFIGSHLCKRLLDQGDQVLCVDNFLTSSLDNIQPLLENPSFEFIRHDVCSPLSVDEVDEIYNLASPASPVHYRENPVQTVKTNVEGAINMLELARRTKAKILQTSTSEVYGDPQVHPQKEDYWGHVNPIGPRSCYDEGKRCAETLFLAYHLQHGLPYKIVRIFNTYGPVMQIDDGRVVSNFIVQALEGRDLTIQGTGHQTRSFCYVDDMVEGLLHMMKSPEEFMGPVNLGNPSETTVLKLVEMVLSLTGSKSKMVHHPLPQDDPTRRRPDISLAKEKLNWTPKVELEEGLQKTIAYFEQLLKKPMGRKIS